MGGIRSYKVKNVYVDCLTPKYSFKVDFAKNNYRALREALKYKKLTKKKPAVTFIVRDKNDKKYIDKIKSRAKKYNIRLFTIDSKYRVKAVK